MTTVFASDILPTDILVDVKCNEDGTAESQAIQRFMDRNNLKRGDRIVLNNDTFHDLLNAIADVKREVTAGGSTAGILTMAKKLNPELNVEMFGVVGDGEFSASIRNEMNKEFIFRPVDFKPWELSHKEHPHEAITFILQFPDGQTSSATYEGNAPEILKPKKVTKEVADDVKVSDMLVLSGSHWEKFPHRNGDPTNLNEGPTVAEKLIDARWQAGTSDAAKENELCMLLPKTAFETKDPDKLAMIIPSANMVLANGEILMNLYNVSTYEEALEKLHADFVQEKSISKNSEWKGSKRQVGFVVLGNKSAIVTAKGIKELPDQKTEIFSAFGAEDAAFSGFFAGHTRGLNVTKCADMAMAMATIKADEHKTLVEDQKISGPRIANPVEKLHAAYPTQAKEWVGAKSPEGSVKVAPKPRGTAEAVPA